MAKAQKSKKSSGVDDGQPRTIKKHRYRRNVNKTKTMVLPYEKFYEAYALCDIPNLEVLIEILNRQIDVNQFTAEQIAGIAKAMDCIYSYGIPVKTRYI